MLSVLKNDPAMFNFLDISTYMKLKVDCSIKYEVHKGLKVCFE